MKTDIKRITEVTREMKLNDMVYDRMRDELDEYIDLIADEYPEELPDHFEELYFYQRVLSVLSNYDLPLKAAIGYFDLLTTDGSAEPYRHDKESLSFASVQFDGELLGHEVTEYAGEIGNFAILTEEEINEILNENMYLEEEENYEEFVSKKQRRF